MSEWDGRRVRDLYQNNIPGMLDVMERVNWDQQNEVQILIARIRDLVLASQNKHDPGGLREPLNALVNAMATHAPVFITDPQKYELYLFGRFFVTAASKVVDLPKHSEPDSEATDADFQYLMNKFAFPTGPAPPPILQHPTDEPIDAHPTELANVEVKSTIPAKRKLVFTEDEEVPTSPKLKESDAAAVDDAVADSPRVLPAKKVKVEIVDDAEVKVMEEDVEKEKSEEVLPAKKVKVEIVDDAEVEVMEEDVEKEKGEEVLPVKKVKVEIVDDAEDEMEDDVEKKKCDHCDLEVPISETEQLKHAWKKHKNMVHKHIRPELVCTIDYCDYVSSSVQARKIHVGRTRGCNPLVQRRVVSELKASKCPYCAVDIDSIVSLKQHSVQCTQRDERPMLGCSSCHKQSFHFIYDFTAHLKKYGGVAHGNPTLLSYK